MVLAHFLSKWRRGLKLHLGVAHVHHGPSDSPEQSAFRNKAREFTREWAKANQVPFFTNPTNPPRTLVSELEWRNWREEWLKTWVQLGGFDTVAMAHHLDDLLETRLLRLLRGTGSQGLRAMAEYSHGASGAKWRPLLKTSRSEIVGYARAQKLKWLEDPSNRSTQQLRNWLRRDWLPHLERRQPGAGAALARSLENLVSAFTAPTTDEFSSVRPYVGLRRDEILSVSTPRQREMVARYLRSMGLKGYQSTHVEELLKRMQLSRDTQTFAMLGHNFHISREFVWASRV
jgi:tRNA(Ile)-lysidine synthase